MERLRRTLARGLEHPAIAWALAAGMAAHGVSMALDPGWLHDEGLLTYGFARSMAQAPGSFVFFQKCKPSLAALYVLPATFGIDAFLVTHAVLTALAAPLAADAARALGARQPNVAALTVALSPLLLRAGGMGISNADGVLVAMLTIALLARERWAWAGLVFGVSVWVRYELALFGLPLLGLACTARARWPLAAGMLAFPALYVTAGAAYHADLLWVLHIPPGTTGPMPGWGGQQDPFRTHTALSLAHALFEATPALALVPLVPDVRRHPVVAALILYVAVTVLLFAITHVTLLPIGPAFVLGFADHYALLLLPPAAVLAALALEPPRPFDPGWSRALLACALLMVGGLALRVVHDERSLLLAAAAAASVLAAAAWPHRGPGLAALPIAAVPVAALLVAAPFLCAPWLERGGYRSHGAELDAECSLLERHRARLTGTVYTTSDLLQPFLARSGRLTGVRVEFLRMPDHLWELGQLTSTRHDQRRIVTDVLLSNTFGRVHSQEFLRPSEWHPGDAILARHDERAAAVLPEAEWHDRLEALGRTGDGHQAWTLFVPRADDPGAPAD